MPKKRPLTKLAHERLTNLAREARAAVLNFRSAASAHFSVYESIPHRTQRLFEDVQELLKELKDTKPE